MMLRRVAVPPRAGYLGLAAAPPATWIVGCGASRFAYQTRYHQRLPLVRQAERRPLGLDASGAVYGFVGACPAKLAHEKRFLARKKGISK